MRDQALNKRGTSPHAIGNQLSLQNCGFTCRKRHALDPQPAPLPARYSPAFAANCAEVQQRIAWAAEEHHAKRQRGGGRGQALPRSDVQQQEVQQLRRKQQRAAAREVQLKPCLHFQLSVIRVPVKHGEVTKVEEQVAAHILPINGCLPLQKHPCKCAIRFWAKKPSSTNSREFLGSSTFDCVRQTIQTHFLASLQSRQTFHLDKCTRSYGTLHTLHNLHYITYIHKLFPAPVGP